MQNVSIENLDEEKNKPLVIKSNNFSFVHRKFLNNLYPKNYDELERLVKVFLLSNSIPEFHSNSSDPVASAIAVIYKGAELGLPIMASLEYITRINGRMTLWGDAILALVKISPDYEYVKELFDDATMTATCICKRKNEPFEVIRKFSLEDAIKSEMDVFWNKSLQKLVKLEPWRKYPKRMVQLKARKWSVFDTWPQAFCGLNMIEDLTPEQIEGYEIDIINEKIEPINLNNLDNTGINEDYKNNADIILESEVAYQIV